MIITSSQRLCENYDDISRLAKEHDEPIFITKDGEGDLVLLSMQAYERLEKRESVPAEPVPHERDRRVAQTKGGTVMDEFALGQELRRMYDNAPRGDQVAFIHLFGIRFWKELTGEGLNKKEILRSAGLPESYVTEISKGAKLGGYVTIDPAVSEKYFV